MNVLRLTGATFIVCVLAIGIRADDKKDNAKLVVGKWKVVKASPDTFPLGTIIEMSDDARIKVTAKRDNKEVIHEGTYKVDSPKIIITVKVEGQNQEHVLTITKIDEATMVTDHLGGGRIEFKKEK